MSESPLPDRAPSDSDEAWGDARDQRSDDEDDERLVSERPPHYDR